MNIQECLSISIIDCTISYLGSVVIFSIASMISASVILLKSNRRAIPILIHFSTLMGWSQNMGIPTIGTPWWMASMVPNNPPWDMKPRILGWARISCCGAHFINLTFGGSSSPASVSNFHNTFCFSLENALNRIFNCFSGSRLDWIKEPRLK